MRSHQVEPFAVKEVEAADSDQEGEDKMGIWKKFGFACPAILPSSALGQKQPIDRSPLRAINGRVLYHLAHRLPLGATQD
jgi:hypothetical protein